jgi:hypothetical protein
MQKLPIVPPPLRNDVATVQGSGQQIPRHFATSTAPDSRRPPRCSLYWNTGQQIPRHFATSTPGDHAARSQRQAQQE